MNKTYLLFAAAFALMTGPSLALATGGTGEGGAGATSGEEVDTSANNEGWSVNESSPTDTGGAGSTSETESGTYSVEDSSPPAKGTDMSGEAQ